jgi:ribosomal protein L11 methylase PrmA
MGRSWFNGDRTLSDQLKGLGRLLGQVSGKTVCDFGCAEGLIGLKLLELGAVKYYGCDINKSFIDAANKHRAEKAFFQNISVDELVEGPVWHYDIALALAILHKLRNPFKLVDFIVKIAPDLVVVRLPASTPGFVQDKRSSNIHFDVTGRFAQRGYLLDETDKGHFNEWVGYYVRRA